MTYKATENHGNLATIMMNGLAQPDKLLTSDGDLSSMAAAQSNKLLTPSPSKSKSVPSTPLNRSHSPGGDQSTPSTNRPTREGSPRSIHSGSSQTPPAHRRPAGGCKYETGMAKARRRVPYSMGPEKLETNVEEASKQLGSDEERILTKDMQTLYQRLLPTAGSERRRKSFVQKLERLIKTRWPGAIVQVSVFGSTGNRLGTNDSDVDVCITTDSKEMERVCSIAELLASNGMERVVCVSSARVPIVKVWDPELQVACDMNVNNPIALENTELIKSYVSIDDRFRPLAMIIKYWAKRRVLNDAALGGTLSSYTWICLVLNFLQTLHPPILPSLQAQPNLPTRKLGDVNVAFDKDLNKYQNFGSQNTSTLGELLYQFFRYYGHQLDLESSVMSVREGKVIPKSKKGWDRLQDNRLCVEEPFNIGRNLANTADDTSMRGIHLELRRAFDMVAAGKLEFCCEEYIPPLNEFPAKTSEKFIQPTTRTIIPQPPPQSQPTPRANRSGYKSSRNSNRNSGAGRRASNPTGRQSTYLRDLPFAMTPQELQLQAQHQQHLLHDQLFQQYQYLQLQEQELRIQLYQQSLRQRGLMASNGYNAGSISGSDSIDDGQDPSLAARSMSTTRVPLSAPLYQQRFNNISPYTTAAPSSSGVITNPGSPLLSTVPLDTHRYTRRASDNNNTTGSLRAHSQPARSMPGNAGLNMRHGFELPMTSAQILAGRRSSVAASLQDAQYAYSSASIPSTLYDAGRRPVEYVGYYVGQSPSLAASSRSTAISPIPSHAGLAIHNGGLSPRLSTRSSRIPSVTSSPSLQQASLASSALLSGSAADTSGLTESSGQQSPKMRAGPLVVDGSVYSPYRRQTISRVTSDPTESLTMSASTSEDPAFDTPSSSDELAHTTRAYSEVHTNLIKMQAIQEAHVRLSNRASQNGLDENRGVGAFDDNVTIPRGNSGGDDNTGSTLPEKLAHYPLNGASGYRQTIGKREPLVMPSQSSSMASEVPLTPRTNGLESSSSTTPITGNPTAPNGWQTQTKKKKNKKKGAKLDSGAVTANPAGGEELPEDESLRKGG